MNRHIAIFTLATLAFSASVGLADDSRNNRRGSGGDPKGPRAFRGAPARLAVHRSPWVPVTRDIIGDQCATTARAEADARRHLVAEVKDWLAESGVPRSWTPPKAILNDMVVGQPDFSPETIVDQDHELNLVRATIKADFSDARKNQLLKVYGQHVGGHRLALFGGGLVVILAGLAAISGYIRADEASKGYYTNRLRLLAAAGVGAAGVVVYRVLT